MACLHAELDGGVQLHVCRPNGTTEPAKRRRRRFWCFSCRKRVLHSLMVFRQEQPSYYDDFAWWECPTCKGDYTSFPGF